MSKKKEEVFSGSSAEEQEQAQLPAVESGSPAFVDELLKNGKAVLTAKTREDIAEMVNNIPAECSYRAGAVGYNHETGTYSLRIDLTKKD